MVKHVFATICITEAHVVEANLSAFYGFFRTLCGTVAPSGFGASMNARRALRALGNAGSFEQLRIVDFQSILNA